MIALQPLTGTAKDVEGATALRTPALVEQLHADLERAVTGSRTLPESERARLPAVIAALSTIDDAGWWLAQAGHLPPFTSKRAYEDHPWPLWNALQLEVARRVAAAGTVEGFGVEAEPCALAQHQALAPAIPNDVEAALRKSNHWRFLVARGPAPRIVAIHRGGIRFVGANGKVVARGLGKGGGQVEGAAIADDGSFVLLRNAVGLHWLAIPDKRRVSLAAPAASSHAGLCSLAGGRFAMVSNDEQGAALTVYTIDDDRLERRYAARHGELDGYASLDRCPLGDSAGDGDGDEDEDEDDAGDLIFARTSTPTGERVTLLARDQGGVLTWLGRHPESLSQPRRASDGSIVALVGRDAASRLWVRR